jgi:hypothetical protein
MGDRTSYAQGAVTGELLASTRPKKNTCLFEGGDAAWSTQLPTKALPAGSVKTALGPYVVLILLISTPRFLRPIFNSTKCVEFIRSFSFLGFSVLV